jgi:hypothetical protein
VEGRYRYGVGTGTGVVEGDNFFCAFMTPGSGICFVLFYFEGSGRREWMGDGCGSGTGLDPDSIFYCASLSLYYFMFPALLHRADTGDRAQRRYAPAAREVSTGIFYFFSGPETGGDSGDNFLVPDPGPFLVPDPGLFLF